MSIENLRSEIDLVDKQLVDILEKRMNLSKLVAEYKIEHQIPILNQGREDEVIKKNVDLLKNDMFSNCLTEIMNTIMKESRVLQEKQIKKANEEVKKNISLNEKENMKNINVAYQGISGAFGEQALNEYFGVEVKSKNYNSFGEVFSALKEEEVDYGILPIENSSTGAVTEVYDLLREHGFFIVGEKCITVEHHLLGLPGSKISDIEEIYSHPQALSQSSVYLNKYPDWLLIPYKNTAISAKYIKEARCKSKGAVGSFRAAKVYGLDILEHNINYNSHNKTRFIVIGRDKQINKAVDKVSVVVTTPHKPGALYNILKYFAKHDLNMMKIESRPTLDKPWEYFFYIDFEGCLKDEIVKNAIDLIRENSVSFQLLGNYKRDEDLV